MTGEEYGPRGRLAVLRHRDFRLLWLGQIGSQIGSRMQGAALLWHLYDMTRQPESLGAIGLARLVPLVALALVGGAFADAVDRRRLMLACQCAMLLLSAILGLASLAGVAAPWMIYGVAAITAGIMTFDGPARQSLLPSLVPRAELAHAVSLNSLSSQFCSILGPSLMGLILAARQPIGVVYLLNAASFLSVISALLLMRSRSAERGEGRPRVTVAAIREGLSFVRHSPILLSIMVLDFVANLFASANTLLPIVARDILRVGPEQYGLLAGAQAVGSLLAAAVLALFPPARRQGWIILTAVFLFGAATVLFGASQIFLLSYLALAAIGATDTVSMVLRHTIRQLVTPDALRGRMTSINQLFVQGGPHLGEMEAGWVAAWRGAPFSIVSGGIACMIAVLGFVWWSPRLRDYQASGSESETQAESRGHSRSAAGGQNAGEAASVKKS